MSTFSYISAPKRGTTLSPPASATCLPSSRKKRYTAPTQAPDIHPNHRTSTVMTPAIKAAKKAKISFQIHEYHHDPSATSYGAEAAEKLGVAPERVYKTLVTAHGTKDLVVAIVPVLQHLNLKALAKHLGVKKVAMADTQAVQNTTGYILGGVSPLGQKKRLPTVIDASAEQYDTIFVSAGRRGMDIELAPSDLLALTTATYADIAKDSR